MLRNLLRKILAPIIIISWADMNYASEKAIFHYEGGQIRKKRIVDLSGNNHDGIIKGNVKTIGSVLSLDGGNTGIDVLNSNSLNAGNGATYLATVKFNNVIDDRNDENAYYDAVMYKDKQFVLSKRGKRFYCNFHDGQTWSAQMNSPIDVKLEAGKWYHLALSFDFHNIPSLGEKWTVMKLYVNGRCVAGMKSENIRPTDRNCPLQLGKADGFGRGWSMSGAIAEAAMYTRSLSDSEIQKLVIKQKLVVPDFEDINRLSAVQRKIIAKLKSRLTEREQGLLEMLESAARIKNSGFNFDRAVKVFEHALAAETGSHEIIKELNQKTKLKTLAADSAFLSYIYDRKAGKFFLVNVYDRKASRLIFSGAQKLWELSLKSKNRNLEYSAVSKELRAELTASPVKVGEGWTFTVKWRHPGFEVESNFSFKDRRLEYDLKAQSIETGTVIRRAVFPSMKLRELKKGTDTLLVPLMSGKEIYFPVKENSSYGGSYPTGRTSMQLGAYYDSIGGVYFATEDPLARSKELSFSSNAGIVIKYFWNVGFVPGCKNHFDSECNAVFEGFDGGWYDAGQLYRRWLAKLNAKWWIKSLPRKDTPKWFLDNTLWLRYSGGSERELYLIRKYFGLPFALHWYGWNGKFDRDYPHYRFTPDGYELLHRLRDHGIRVVPYTNGRLWETKDRRLEDWEFTKKALPCVVKNMNGMPVTEQYHDAEFGVMCPYTKMWRRKMLDNIHEIMAFGFDGVYCDQVAAARPRFCFDASHGHMLNDCRTWYMQGYLPMFDAIRKMLKTEYPQGILTTEDNAEAYIRDFDGLLPWRWMNNNQVPLFILVYSGRAQFTGLCFGAQEKGAEFPMLANQLVNGEQLGWFSHKSLFNLDNTFRLYVKNSMFIRKAMLKYFNEGMLARPIKFGKNLEKALMKWGKYCDKYVNTPYLVSNAWKYKNTIAYLIVNSASKKIRQKVIFNGVRRGFNSATVKINIFDTDKKMRYFESSGSFERDAVFEPYSAQLWIISPKGNDISTMVRDTEKIFEQIRSFPDEADPFACKLEDTPPVKSQDWHLAYKAPQIFSGKRDKDKQCVSYITSGTLIYFGSIDFGQIPPEKFEAVAAVPAGFTGHKAELCIDDPKNGKTIAVFDFNNHTESWEQFGSYMAEALCKVSGVHRVFMKFTGGAACNMRKWRVIK